MKERFVKLPLWLFNGYPAVSISAKVLWCILRDKITYSKYFDDVGQYYYFSSDERISLTQLLHSSPRGFDRLLKELRDNDLLKTHQFGSGIRTYLTPEQNWRTEDQFWRTGVVNFGEPPGSILANPLNKTTGKQDIQNKMDTDIFIPDLNEYKKENVDIPSFIDVLKYWSKRNYHSNPSSFYSHYTSLSWKIGEDPIFNWKKLADTWENNEFVEMPVIFNSEEGLAIYNKLPEDLKQQIENDQSASGGLRIRKRTYEKVMKTL